MKKITLLLLSFMLFSNSQLMAQWYSPAGSTTYSFDNIGIGTSTPAAKLHVQIPSGFLTAKFSNTATSGDRTALVDIQNGQGILWRYGVGGTGNGLGITSGQFYIERAGLGCILALTTSGTVGIGTTAPGSYKLKVAHGSFGLNLENVATGNDWELWTNSAASNAPLNLYYNGSFKGSFNASSGAYSASSDERLKTNIKAMPSVLEKVNQLKPATYQFKASITPTGDMPESYGFLAQDVMQIFPNLVTHHVDKERGLDSYTMDYSGFGIIAIKAIQELQQTNQEQLLKNSKLEERVAKLEAALSAIKPVNPNLINKEILGVSLEQNHPNPVDENTTFRYTIPAGVSAQILIYEISTGKLVKTLQAPVSGQVQMNARELKTGTYVYSLMVDGQLVASKQLILRSR